MREQRFSMRVIARVRSDFPSKFGVPRQSGLVDALAAAVILEPAFRNRDALRGLSGFSHIWLLWAFHQNGPSAPPPAADRADGLSGPERLESRWSPTVRPPRLGGNRRMGVFATRSPFRPNPIGLSCVRLEAIDETAPDGPVLRIRGADLTDGTPVLDIKPYLPYTDCVPHAAAGFAPDPSGERLDVEIPPEVLRRLPEDRRAALYGVLSLDPRPRYHDDPERVYGFSFAGWEVRFTVDGKRLFVREITREREGRPRRGERP